MFLNVKVSLRNGKVFTDLYVKPTDRHRYLQYFSAYPYCTKKSVFFSQNLRVSRLYSSGKDFENHKHEMKPWFRKREYPEYLSSSEMRKVKFSNLKFKSNGKNHNMKGIPLIVTYHPFLKRLSDKNLSILFMNKGANRVFTQQPMVSFRSARKLNSYLGRAKLYPVKRMLNPYKSKSKQ